MTWQVKTPEQCRDWLVEDLEELRSAASVARVKHESAEARYEAMRAERDTWWERATKAEDALAKLEKEHDVSERRHAMKLEACRDEVARLHELIVKLREER